MFPVPEAKGEPGMEGMVGVGIVGAKFRAKVRVQSSEFRLQRCTNECNEQVGGKVV
jgi:hypothetical protein